jgi:hypothetical protein
LIALQFLRCQLDPPADSEAALYRREFGPMQVLRDLEASQLEALAFVGAELAKLKRGGDGSNQHSKKRANVVNTSLAPDTKSRASIAKEQGGIYANDAGLSVGGPRLGRLPASTSPMM